MKIPRTKPCRADGCDVRIVMAFRTDIRRWAPFEATDVPAFSDQAGGALVLVHDQAWKPRELIEHWQAYHELSEPGARELVSHYPFHRLHYHPTTPEEGTTTT